MTTTMLLCGQVSAVVVNLNWFRGSVDALKILGLSRV